MPGNAASSVFEAELISINGAAGGFGVIDLCLLVFEFAFDPVPPELFEFCAIPAITNTDVVSMANTSREMILVLTSASALENEFVPTSMALPDEELNRCLTRHNVFARINFKPSQQRQRTVWYPNERLRQ